MLALTIRGLWSYKRRLFATVLAVALGVAFLAGTLLLSDTLRANFDRLFSQANSGTDVVVRSATKVAGGSGSNARTAISAAALSKVRAVDGVANAQPYLEGFGQLLDSHGKAIGGGGPETTAANWISDPSLNPYQLVQGRAPVTDDEAVINRGAAQSGHLAIGSTTTLLTPKPITVRVVGIATFGTADGFGPGTFTGLTLHAAQQDLTGATPDQFTQILIRAERGVSAEQLVARLQPALGTRLEAITGRQLAAENSDQINSGFLGFLSSGLTAFAVIALLVAAFSIYNTFSILGAQRGRESALLRALGGSRRQLVAASMLETLTVGVLGSALGWAGGIGIAALLKGVFDSFGFALPAGGLVFKASSAVIAVLVGVLATVLAGIAPAVRSARIPPVAAMRELAAESTRISPRRLALGAVLAAAGIAAVIAGTLAGNQTSAIAGAVTLTVGVIVLGPVAAKPAAIVLGAPIAALRGVSGRLARNNALRNPRRTAATASALLVGVAVAALFTVIGASLKASAAHGIDRSLTADLVVDQGGYGGSAGGGGVSPQLATDLARLPQVRLATGLGTGSALIGGKTRTVAVADPAAIGSVVNLGFSSGGLDDLDAGSFAVSSVAADDEHWRVGSAVPVTYPDGAAATLASRRSSTIPTSPGTTCSTTRPGHHTPGRCWTPKCCSNSSQAPPPAARAPPSPRQRNGSVSRASKTMTSTGPQRPAA
jgi:putative ABC transport system permease protein